MKKNIIGKIIASILLFATYSLPSEEKGCHNDKNIVLLAEN